MRILVVEDEPDLLSTIARALREQGYAVDEACDGKNAFFNAFSNSYDAIVLDLMLPEMGGIEFIKKVRKSKATPILILSALDTVGDRVEGLNIGADDYLVKPFSMVELFARLQALIRRAAGVTANIISVGELTIDLGTKIAGYAGRKIDLTPKEFSLLELMVLNRNKVVSRTAIYEHIYDSDDDTMSNLVDVHIFNLRKKLEKDIIETRRGLGYIICD